MLALQTIRWKNFLSTGNYFNELKLDADPTTLIAGGNGCGKTTGIQALVFALYGRSLTGINRPQLINNINEKGTEVEVEFKIGSKQFKVVRGIRPNKFEIYENDVLLDQDSNQRHQQLYLERNVLKISFRTFIQVVVLGSGNYVPFMKLRAFERREIVEDLLDIRIFSVMNTLAKEEHVLLKASDKELQLQIEMQTSKVELIQKHISELSSNKREIIDEKRTKQQNIKDYLNESKEKIATLLEQIEEQKQDLLGEEQLSRLEQSYTIALPIQSKLDYKSTVLRKELQFFETNSTCPTCRQEIDEQFKADAVDERQEKLIRTDEGLIKVGAQLETIKTDKATQKAIKANIRKLSQQANEIKGSVKANIDQYRALGVEIQQLAADDSTVGKDTVDELTAARSVEADLLQQRATNATKLKYYGLIILLLKDTGIKAQIIKQYLPVMNALINKYLGVFDFSLKFELDENFNEIIKSRGREEMSYNNFSEGEKMRINLAILFAWREVAKLRASAHTNLLFLDETFDASLDQAGTDDLFKLMRLIEDQTNTFVISHKSDILADKFRNVITFEKKGDFSVIVNDNETE